MIRRNAIVAAVSAIARSPVSRRSILTMLDQGIFSGTNFVTGIIVGRFCLKEEFGLYTLGLSLLVVVAGFCASICNTPYLIMFPQKADCDKPTFTGSMLLVQVAVLLAITVSLLAIQLYYHLWLEPDALLTVFQVLSVVAGFIVFRQFLRSVCFAQMRAGSAVVLDLSVCILQISIFSVAAWWGCLNATMALLVVGAVCGVATTVLVVNMRSLFKVSLSRVRRDARQIVQVSKWIMFSGIACSLSGQVLPWLLTAYHGVSKVAEMGACLGLLGLINPILLGVGNVVGPSLSHAYARGGAAELRVKFVHSCVGYLLCLAPVCICIVVYGERLVVMAYGDRYAAVGGIFALMAVARLLGGLSFPLSRALFVLGNARGDTVAVMTSLVCNIVAGICFVKWYGIVGVGMVLVASQCVGLVTRTMFLRNALSR